ncbi:MAG TPA: tetratricopeptide repeat protein [Rhizomicrobium sp.]|nr:tetratricopeptide repeat protein [Rhizomicrobium sp.]
MIKRILFVAGLGVLLTATAASAAPVACAFTPDIGFTNESRIPGYMFTIADASLPTEVRVCAMYGLGTLYALDGDYRNAITFYDKAIGWWRGYSDAYEMRGDAYAALGKADLAAQSYALSAAGVADRRKGLDDRCWARAIRGTGLERALADCNAVVGEYDDDYEGYKAQCLVLYRLGRYGDAVASCTRALHWHPRSADAFYVRGLAELAKGNAAMGQTDIATAKDADYRIELKYAMYGIKTP